MIQREKLCNIIRTYTQQQDCTVDMQEMANNFLKLLNKATIESEYEPHLSLQQLDILSSFMLLDKSDKVSRFTHIENFIFYSPHYKREQMSLLEVRLIQMMVYATGFEQRVSFHYY